MDDMRKYINLIESAEQLDEIDFKKAAATAGLIGALAGAPMDAKADNTDIDPQLDKPVATQQVDDTNKQSDPKADKKAKKYLALDKDIAMDKGFDKYFGLYDVEFDKKKYPQNVFAPGRAFGAFIPFIKKIHDQRPAEFGKPISKIQLKPSDHARADFMAVIEYENGRLEYHMVEGGKLKSVLVWQVNNAQISKDMRYIPIFINWHSKDSYVEPKTDYDL